MGYTDKELKSPDVVYWPEVRWWLAEGFHTDRTLKEDVKMIYEAGFGGAEFLAMDEDGADSSRYGWGSEEWVHDSHMVIEEATKRGMAASVTSGTNWSNANLTTIKPDDRAAAKELDFTRETLKPNETRRGPLAKAQIRMPQVYVQELIAVVAVKRLGEDKDGRVLLDRESIQVLTDRVAEGELTWTAPEDGEYELLTFWLHGTGQTANPSVSVSYTVNYLDSYGVEALIDYWEKEVLTAQLKEQIKKNGRVQMYMDSLELSTYGAGGQFWGYHLTEEFKERRGYELEPLLPFVVRQAGGVSGSGGYYFDTEDREFTTKLRNDLYQTMTELYMDRMLKPFQEWLHSVGMTLRAEISYGMPFEISLPGKYVDGIETESLEFASQPDSYRNLAGPAHLFKRLYSSETGATLHNYMRGLDFYTQIIYAQFASGVSRTVLHGYSSIAGSEDSTYWPGHEGMWPIFSERFGCRQPAFQHYNDWTAMLARHQMILRQGKPRVDLGMVRLDYHFNNFLGSYGNEKDVYEGALFRANEGIYWKDMSLQNHGYTYEYFAPQILNDPDIRVENGVLDPEGAGYRALILYQDRLPLQSAKEILSMAKEGLPVVIVNGVTEMLFKGHDCFYEKAASKTPFLDGKDEDLAKVMRELKSLDNVREVEDQSQTLSALESLGVEPRVGYGKDNSRIISALRSEGTTSYLFLYNYMYTETEPYTFTVVMEGEGKPYLIDAWQGTQEEILPYRKKDGKTYATITLAPGEAVAVKLEEEEKEELYPTECTADFIRKTEGKYRICAENEGVYVTRMSDNTLYETKVEGAQTIPLGRWDLTVEDWNEGDKVGIPEDRGLGYVTNEVYYETKKTKIHVGETDLVPWKDIEEVGPQVSGVGYYRCSVTVPDTWKPGDRAVLRIGSTNGNSAALFINGKKGPAVDFDSLETEVGDFLNCGENTIEIEVSSTLNNRLIARGYYETKADPRRVFGEGGAETYPKIQVQDYGMTGEVSLVLYKEAEVK